MSKANELTAHLIGEEWDSVEGASEPDWYALTDNHVAVRGPFDTREQCEKAIKREVKRSSRT